MVSLYHLVKSKDLRGVHRGEGVRGVPPPWAEDFSNYPGISGSKPPEPPYFSKFSLLTPPDGKLHTPWICTVSEKLQQIHTIGDRRLQQSYKSPYCMQAVCNQNPYNSDRSQ